MNKLRIGNKTGLKYFSYNDIVSWKPCYDPIKYMSKDWRGTAIDILNNQSIPFKERLWCVLRKEIISEKTMRLFAVWCYRNMACFVKNLDNRNIEVINVVERYVNDLANIEELRFAKKEALGIAYSASYCALDDSSDSAYKSAIYTYIIDAYNAGYNPNWCEWDIIMTVWDKKDFGNCRTVNSNGYFLNIDAYFSKINKQKDKLIEMLLNEGKERVVKKNKFLYLF